MIGDLGGAKKTIIGIHNRIKNSFSVVEHKYPVVNDEQESIFLITRDHFFSITSQQIKAVLQNFSRYQNFNALKRLIADLGIVPGLIIAFGFILKYTGLLDDYPVVLSLLNLRIIGPITGFSILSVIVLWHDFYEDKSHPIQLPKIKDIPQKDIEEIKAIGFKFGRYAHHEIISFANEDFLEYVCEYTENGVLNTFEMYSDLVSNNFETKQIIRKSGIQIDSELLEAEGIDSQSMPSIPESGIRTLFVYAMEEALLAESKELEPEHLFLAITKMTESVQSVLKKRNIPFQIFREVCAYENELIAKRSRAKYFDPNVPYFRKGGIGKAWIYGWTFVLNHFSKDLTKVVAESRDTFGIGHDEEVSAIVSVLGKMSNKNALMIGEPGVGKSSIILGLAQRINYADVPLQLKDKRIIQIDLNNLVATSQKLSNLEEVVVKTMNELEKAGNTILYIDEIQQLIPSKEGDAGYNLAGVFLPYVLNSKFPIVGSINYADYKKYFYNNESFRQSFTNVEIKEVAPTDALRILESKIPSLEQNFNCYITFPALFASVELSQRYIKERKLPSSAVQTIESTCAWAQSNGVSIVTDEHVSKTISLQKNINITAIDKEESSRLMKLEENIRRKVVGQDEAVLAISEALRRARTDIRNPNKPIGVFMFMGPTGVGKTHLAKAVGEEYFGSKDNLIRVDMSEYQEISSIQRFLGASESSSFGPSSISLVDKIKSNPHSVVLFDEIEKAHPNILDLFLQIFDEGILTSSHGETVDFTNSIIICTSNIGSKVLLDTLQNKSALWEEAKNMAMLELRQSIKPELLNRFDKVIVFAPHDVNNLAEIAVLLLTDLANILSAKGITLNWANQIPMLIASKSNEPGMGARPMRRYIQDKIEGQIAKEMIEGTIKSGDDVSIKESWIV